MQQAKHLLYNSLAPSTRRNYDSITWSYESCCRKYNYYPSFPTSFKTISHWLAEIMSSIKPTTAKSYLHVLHSRHLKLNSSIKVFKDARIDLIIRGRKRVFGEGTKKLQLPLTAPIFFRVFNGIRNDEEGVNLKLALCMAFAAFLRSGEFTWDSWSRQHHVTHLTRKHIHFNLLSNSVTLTPLASKTDPYHNGVDIQLASSSSALCPVTALKLQFNSYPHSPDQLLFMWKGGTQSELNRTKVYSISTN